MNVAVVTDGAAALPSELAERWGITVVPLGLTVAGVPEPEGARPLAELAREADVLTSAPTPGEFDAAIAARLTGASGVVVCTMARSMSATNEAAHVGAAGQGRVRIVDSGSAAGGQALVVLAAAAAAAAGASLDAVAARATRVAERVRVVATLPGLDHLVRSGRVPGVVGWAGKRLGVHPLFELRGGVVRTLRPALSDAAAQDRMLSLVGRSAVVGAALHVAVLHAEALSVAAAMLDRVCAELRPVESFVASFGPVMFVHTGPGLVGLAWWWDDLGRAAPSWS